MLTVSNERGESSRAAVFICSSDSRRDVLSRVLPSVLRFWTDRTYPLYVGMSSPLSLPGDVKPIYAPASDWRGEFTRQLAQIPQDYIVLLLDDFLVHAPVDQVRMSQLVSTAIDGDFQYLRLVPLGRSLASRITGRRPAQLLPGIEEIPSHHPFFCGLQAAIWHKRYLLSLLEAEQSIWEFERRSISGSRHYAINTSAPIRYRHLVERGRWLPYARSLLQRAGLPDDLGDRMIWPRSRYGRLLLDQLSWVIVGHSTC